jgi:FlaA1/EpsC-like NDP-sugar epimerase
MKKIFSYIDRRIIVFIHDFLFISLAWLGAYWLRFNLGPVPSFIFHQALHALPIVLLLQSISYCIFGVYRSVWRFFSLPDLFRILKAVVSGAGLSAMVLFFDPEIFNFPRSIFFLYALLLMAFLCGPRFLYRRIKAIRPFSKKMKIMQRVLIVGAGQAGEGLAREILRGHFRTYKPVGFVDDKRHKLGLDIHGIPVLGSCSEVSKLVRRLNIDLIFIAMPSASSSNMRTIVGHCENAGVPFRTLPGMHDLVSGRLSINSLREVSLEDLLGRDPVHLDWTKIQAAIQSKVVLVSGGGGSIGLELCRQISKLHPKQLIILEHNEFNLYTLQQDLQIKNASLILHGYLVDVTDKSSVERIIEKHQPEIIFHAAAYKHVPMLEKQIRQAVKNNVLGTKILSEAALQYGVEKFVLISTDKAVNPTNIMGATKRVAEIICQILNAKQKTHFITVRFGNVLGSAGSVIPLFRRQLESGGPLTVTHPEITRFFMTIPEASQLILQATAIGLGGEVLVLDMGEPVKIYYLAEQMIRLSGKVPGDDIEIKCIGLRPGEKLFEELFYAAEASTQTEHEKIFRVTTILHQSTDDLNLLIEALLEACYAHNEVGLRHLLTKLVPEYQPENASLEICL